MSQRGAPPSGEAKVGSQQRQRRCERLWDAMRDAGLDALVIAGRGIITQYGYLYYVAGYYPLIRHGYAVLAPGLEPALVLPTASDAYFADAAGTLSDVRVAGQGDVVSANDHLPGGVRDVLIERGLDRGRIGFVGLQHIVPAGDYLLFQQCLGQVEIVDATNLMSDIKAIKDADDVTGLQHAANIADEGFDAAAEMVEAGVPVRHVIAEIERTVRSRGALEVLAFVSSGPYFLTRPDATVISNRDLVTVYVEVTGPNGYWVERAGMFAIGQLSRAQEELARTCLDAVKSAEQELVAGGTAGNVATAIEETCAPAQATSGIWHGHGVGIDHDIPVITKEDDTTLQPGMAIAIHPNLAVRQHEAGSQGRIGASVGDTYVITEDGGPPMRLSSRDQKIRFR